MRKFLIDRLASIMSESKWKQIVGKVVSESAYVSEDSLRNDYERATKDTCFAKIMDIAELQKRQEIVEELQGKFIAKEPFTEEDYANIKRYNIKIFARRTRQIEKAVKQSEDPNDCPNGHNCPEFKEIPEAELLAHLSQGWQIVHNLQNGRVIVKK